MTHVYNPVVEREREFFARLAYPRPSFNVVFFLLSDSVRATGRLGRLVMFIIVETSTAEVPIL